MLKNYRKQKKKLKEATKRLKIIVPLTATATATALWWKGREKKYKVENYVNNFPLNQQTINKKFHSLCLLRFVSIVPRIHFLPFSFSVCELKNNFCYEIFSGFLLSLLWRVYKLKIGYVWIILSAFSSS